MRYTFIVKIPKRGLLSFRVDWAKQGLKCINFCSASRKHFHDSFQTVNLPTVLEKFRRSLVRYFRGKSANFSLIPLDMSNAPVFYRKVWRVCRKIPYGKRATYQDLAYFSGYKKASRAVGNAMKNNPFPIIIPCHRVIRKDGSLGWYSQGLKLKQMLLTLESRGKKR